MDATNFSSLEDTNLFTMTIVGASNSEHILVATKNEDVLQLGRGPSLIAEPNHLHQSYLFPCTLYIAHCLAFHFLNHSSAYILYGQRTAFWCAKMANCVNLIFCCFSLKIYPARARLVSLLRPEEQSRRKISTKHGYLTLVCSQRKDDKAKLFTFTKSLHVISHQNSSKLFENLTLIF